MTINAVTGRHGPSPGERAMREFFESLPGILFITFIFGGWVITGVASSIMDNWRKVRQAEQLAALKQTMVEKGLSAADIERILAAGVGPPGAPKA
jgi:hypothetical protein